MSGGIFGAVQVSFSETACDQIDRMAKRLSVINHSSALMSAVGRLCCKSRLLLMGGVAQFI
jgi:hypothetical protein